MAPFYGFLWKFYGSVCFRFDFSCSPCFPLIPQPSLADIEQRQTSTHQSPVTWMRDVCVLINSEIFKIKFEEARSWLPTFRLIEADTYCHVLQGPRFAGKTGWTMRQLDEINNLAVIFEIEGYYPNRESIVKGNNR